MDLTKYAPKTKLTTPTIFSGVKPVSMPTLPRVSAPTPAASPVRMPAPVKSTPAPAQTPAPMPTRPTQQYSGGSNVSGMTLSAGQFNGSPAIPQVNAKPTPTVNTNPTPTTTPGMPNVGSAPRTPAVPDFNSIMDSVRGIQAGLDELAKNPAPASTPTTPATPAVPSAAQLALEKAEKDYSKYLTPGQDEVAAQTDLDNLIASTRMGYTGIENKVIPMEFITGQLAATERRATDLAVPLEQRLARMQAQRTAALEASKFALERADKKLEADKPVAVGAGSSLVARNPVTGSYETVFTSPKERSNSPIYNEYLDAKTEGYSGSFSDYQTEDANRKRAIVGENGMTTQQTQNFLTITNKYQADSVISAGSKGYSAMSIADQVIANPNSAGNQLKSLYTLVKSLDPDSAVREGEIDLASATNSYLDRFRTSLTRLAEGQVISPAAAVELANATKDLAKVWYEAASRRDAQYISQANVAGVGSAFNQYLSGFNRPYSTVEAGGGQSVEYKDPATGQTGVYERGADGKWYLKVSSAGGASNASADAIAEAIAKTESSGNYNAIGPVTAKGQRAYGKYQVMDFNIPTWTKEVLGQSLTPQQFLANQQAQDTVAKAKIGQLLTQYGNAADVASAWFTGRPLAKAGNASDVTGTTTPEYVKRVLKFLG